MSSPPVSRRTLLCGLISVLAAALAMREMFSTSRLFFARDLAYFFWPDHVWFRRTIQAGASGLWDPYVAFGQSAVADPTRHVFFPPAWLCRLLLPEVPGFNLFVALPVFMGALGAFMWLRRYVGEVAASLGSVVFALSGGVLSSANSPGIAWSVAFIPWTLLASEAACSTTRSTPIALPLTVAVQFLAGEPVTFSTTCFLGLLWVVCHADASLAERLRKMKTVLGGILLGITLASVQLLPLALATSRSVRGKGGLPELLAIHPVRLLETVAFPLFGDPFQPWKQADPWSSLSNGHNPLLLSLYVGPVSLLFAAMGLMQAPRRHALFWACVGATALAFALGRHAGVYPLVQRVVPVLKTFRYPEKYLLFSSVALAFLAAHGWASLEAGPQRGHRIGARVAALAGVLALSLAWRPFPFASLVASLAGQTESAPLLASSLEATLPRLGGICLVLAAGVALCAAGRREARLVPGALYAVLCADLLAVHAGLNPTLPAGFLGRPAWVDVTLRHPSERVYVGGRLSWATGSFDADDIAATPDMLPPAVSRFAFWAIAHSELVPGGHAWGMRDSISADPTANWPHEYAEIVQRMHDAQAAERARFLRAAGVRYSVLPRAQDAVQFPLRSLERLRLAALFEGPPSSRVRVVAAARVEPDLARQREALFLEDLGIRGAVLLRSAPPPAAGLAGPAMAPGAAIVADEPDRVDVQAATGSNGGYLVLYDSYDPDWNVTVDGAPAPLLRAEYLFRSVRLAPGSHRVRFEYWPKALFTGAALSAVSFGVMIARRFRGGAITPRGAGPR